MKILIIRHGDPDYEHDTLTEKGVREATLLAERIAAYEKKQGIRDIYVSSMGRAQKTAQFSLEKMGREATTVYDWLREFPGSCMRPDRGRQFMCWDWLPEDWTADVRYYDKDLWKTTEIMQDPEATAVAKYELVTGELDKVLAQHGYVRIVSNGPAFDEECNSLKGKGFYYRAEQPNNDTLAFFCHFGVESVLLSHLLGISPMVLWHASAAAPTSVTMLASEERRRGIASWRMLSYGDVSHLYAGGEEPSFSARFCECFTNDDERHD